MNADMNFSEADNAVHIEADVNIDTTHEVRGDDPVQWADEFLKDPSKISPCASRARRPP